MPDMPGPNRTTVAIVAIVSSLFGGWGIHKFMLGLTTPGIILAVATCCTAGTVTGIICLIEGIIYLTMTDEQFYQTYVVEKKQWF
jgi:TM2 domain-containing membrane protein YozV